jgi:mono/diheme cytochrome c family protein
MMRAVLLNSCLEPPAGRRNRLPHLAAQALPRRWGRRFRLPSWACSFWPTILLLIFLSSVAVAHAATVAADSTRAERLFKTLSCVECHSVNGVGGNVGPDLGRRIDRNFTFASLASTMWNHAPANVGCDARARDSRRRYG